MEKPRLSNQNEYPDENVLSHHLGEAKMAWDHFMNLLARDYPLFSAEWRYYKDGNTWLCKVTKKAKTICWVSVWQGWFKTTFYFGGKAEPLILNSDLREGFIDQFINGKRYGKIRGITVEIREQADLDTTKQLIDIKEKTK